MAVILYAPLQQRPQNPQSRNDTSSDPPPQSFDASKNSAPNATTISGSSCRAPAQAVGLLLTVSQMDSHRCVTYTTCTNRNIPTPPSCNDSPAPLLTQSAWALRTDLQGRPSVIIQPPHYYWRAVPFRTCDDTGSPKWLLLVSPW